MSQLSLQNRSVAQALAAARRGVVFVQALLALSALLLLLSVLPLRGEAAETATFAATKPTATSAAAPPALPQRLGDTGLYADGSLTQVRADNLPFAPQYPLWTDGASKRRWIHLPPGSFIDASDPDAWQFPIGTRLWKEFAHSGRPVETRMIERLADGQWRFATYIWNLRGDDAQLAPARGVRSLPAPSAPGGMVAIPSQDDCRICHDGGAGAPVLGFGALQLSSDRDPGAVHGAASSREPQLQPQPQLQLQRIPPLDLVGLQSRGLLRHLPATPHAQVPRIAAVIDPTTRAALGYLHANCGHCHNDTGPLAALEMNLRQSVADPLASAARTLQSLLGTTSLYQGATSERQGDRYARRADPRDVDESMLLVRMRTPVAMRRMPPLGVAVPDASGIALLQRWIAQHAVLSPNPQEKLP